MSSEAFRADLLQGKVAFITGGSSGINQAIAARYAALGARVVIVARDQGKLDKAAEALNAARADTCLAISGDVRDSVAMDTAAAAGAKHFGGYDIVIAGAAGNFLGPADKLSSNAFAAVVDIDLKGTFHTFRACHAHLKPRAHLIAISAPQATVAMPLQAHACAAKAGIEALVRTLAIEWGGLDGARVNALSPGLVAGTVGAAIFCKAGGEQSVVGMQPIPRFATLAEVADAAVFLACPLSDYMTGHTLALDGGLTLVNASATAIAAAALAALSSARR